MNEMLTDFPSIEDVRRLHVKRNDTIVLRLKGLIGQDQRQSVADYMGKMFPEQCILVLDESADIEVISS